jgi:uncharacterized membrane protein YkoI
MTTRLIISEQQAEQIGEKRTGGKRDEAFIVFRFRARKSGITAFGVEIKDTGETITVS